MRFLTGFQKAASLGMNAMLGGTEGKSDIAETGATQLKWDYSSDAIPENFGYNRSRTDPNDRVERILRATSKKRKKRGD